MENIQRCDWCNQQREVFDHENKLICEPCYWLKTTDQFFFSVIREKTNKKSNYVEN